MPGVFFSCRGAKGGWAGVPASASLRAENWGLFKLTAPAYYFGVKLMFVVHVQLLKFIVVKIFGHVLTLNLVIFIWSCE